MSNLDGSRPQFGGRLLDEGKDVFQHNAWDNVEWGEEQEREAQEAVAQSAKKLVSPNQAEEYEIKAGEFWDKFYSIHQNRFFKERNWLFTEFPDLAPGQVVGRERVFASSPTSAGEEIETEAEFKPTSTSSAAESDDVRVILEEQERKLRQDESYFG